MTLGTIDVLILCKKNICQHYLKLQKLKIRPGISVKFIFSDNASNDDTYEFFRNIDLKNKKIYAHEENLGGITNLIF